MCVCLWGGKGNGGVLAGRGMVASAGGGFGAGQSVVAVVGVNREMWLGTEDGRWPAGRLTPAPESLTIHSCVRQVFGQKKGSCREEKERWGFQLMMCES